jgi:hypothetical protein
MEQIMPSVPLVQLVKSADMEIARFLVGAQFVSATINSPRKINPTTGR